MNRIKVCVPDCKCGCVVAFVSVLMALWMYCTLSLCLLLLFTASRNYACIAFVQSFSICSARRRLATADATSIPSLRAMVSTAIAMDKMEFCLLSNPSHNSPLFAHTVCVGREAAYLAVH